MQRRTQPQNQVPDGHANLLARGSFGYLDVLPQRGRFVSRVYWYVFIMEWIGSSASEGNDSLDDIFPPDLTLW